MYIVYFLVGVIGITLIVVVLWLLGKLGSFFSSKGESGALDFFESAVGFLAAGLIGYLVVFFIFQLGEGIVNHLIK